MDLRSREVKYGTARVWEEKVMFPTYPAGEPDKNPMFLEKRVYQGSSGAVYPLPVIDSIHDQKVDQQYTAVYLENDYLKIMILPQLGGRIHMAYDKTNDYHFVYFNRVIKPALVGLAGPWISGGIEFNWPQHHRPSTFMPVPYLIRQNDDGSATCFVSEIDRMYGTSCTTAFTLYPDRASLEVSARLYNRTPLPQTFLWWANPAVHVDEHHQSVFPPDVHAVMDHGKRDVSQFPIARGVYYKMDYSPGTDISRYKNIPVPTSYMAYHSDFDFVASYDHRRRGGLLHVANHHISPGKKQWTWGCGDFGKSWDRQLTDSDGPYIELMCGVFTDNQPDFSWLHPFEEKSFKQYFMPYKKIGVIKNASEDIAIALDIGEGSIYAGVYAIRAIRGARLILTYESVAVLDEAIDLEPAQAFEKAISTATTGNPNGWKLAVVDAAGNERLSYSPISSTEPIPAPADPALPPERIESCEQLYLTGLHLEQYRHATFEPEPYYREALRRDPGDIRNNNALGVLLFRRGLLEEAESCFRAAIRTLTRRNPNPYDSEPYYNLGLTLKHQGRLPEAFEAFYKATWSEQQKASSFFSLALIASINGNVTEALALVEQALIRNAHNLRARNLLTNLLRRAGRHDDAVREATVTLTLDPMDETAKNEIRRLRGEQPLILEAFPAIERATDYIDAGCYEDALAILDRAMTASDYAMLRYLAAFACKLAGHEERASGYFRLAAECSPVRVFPNRLIEMLALKSAIQLDPKDARASYYLGNFWYSKRVYDQAHLCWERAAVGLAEFPTVHRNLALVYFNKLHRPSDALRSLTKAFELDTSDARVLFELDQLRKRMGMDPLTRLEALEIHAETVAARDDLYIERVALLNLLGRHAEALELLAARRFHPWEGGEGKASGNHVAALLGLAKQALNAHEYGRAIDLLNQARSYPENLGEGKLTGAMENDLDYFTGKAMQGMGDLQKADLYFRKAATGLDEPRSAMFYNDQPPHTILYQGLALEALGDNAAAAAKYRKLVDYGNQHLGDEVEIDYFAVSLPEFLVFEDDLRLRNRLHCQYMRALGYIGFQQWAEAERELSEVIAIDPAHHGASVHQAMVARVGRPACAVSVR